MFDGPASRSAAEQGLSRLAWTSSRMPLLAAAAEEFRRTTPFAGLRIGVSLHLEPKTAVLLTTLAAGGAEMVATGNHGSTQDDIVAALKDRRMTIYGRRDDTADDHRGNVTAVLDSRPHLLLDNGGDLAAGVLQRGDANAVTGGTEETTSGADRLRGELAGQIPFPVLVINDSPLKAIGENRHAVGQSIVESFMRITNLMVPGRRFVVVGYGWCGRGIAQYLAALGGRVAVAEIDELKAFEAAMDGYRVAPLLELADWAQVVITATGRPGVVGPEVIRRLSSGAILANAGHFPTEIDVSALHADTVGSARIDDALERIDYVDGRQLTLLAGGRMLNLAGREPKGNSLESMDLGFLLQALCLERVATGAASLQPGPQPVPDDINRTVARRMVAAMGAAA